MLISDNVSLERGGLRVLDGVSAQIQPGQITAVVGPNGAGKSSLLLTLAGLMKPVEGAVLLNGQSLGDIAAREKARALGYLPQSPEIAWDVAVETLVALGRLPHGDRGHAAIDRALSALALEPFRNRPASKLSGGERARVLLARVIAGEPQWILADEPLAALDLAHQLSLIAHLKSCASAGQGVVIVLHDLALAMNHADRVLVLDQGRIIADGPPRDALDEGIIAQGWGVNARWIGEKGERALVTSAKC